MAASLSVWTSWERSFERAELLPVTVLGNEADPATRSPSVGSIHIELAKGTRISLEGNVDPALARAVLESLGS